MKNILFGTIAIFVFVLTVGMATATPSVVTGNVYDSHAANVSGAEVNVTCNGHFMSTTSLGDGSYSVLFDAADCKYLDSVSVSGYRLGVGFGESTGSMCAPPPQDCFPTADNDFCGCPFPVGLVNVTLIPEFGLIGAMIIVIAGLGIVAYRRK